MPAADTAGGDSNEIVTKLARYQAVSWTSLPAWQDDAVQDAYAAFARSCPTLSRRALWAQACAATRVGAGGSPATARLFFESNFDLFSLRTSDDVSLGTLTGYFEPLLRGSPTRREPFVFPVLGVPDDLLTIDPRELSRWPDGTRVIADVSDRQVRLRDSGDAAAAGVSGKPVTLAVPRELPQTIDRKLRVRIEGDRLVQYPSREQIERTLPANGQVIAWVDSAEALYVMQVQGSGRIRFADGATIRVSYAEQNGYTFAPKAVGGPRSRGLGGTSEDPAGAPSAAPGWLTEATRELDAPTAGLEPAAPDATATAAPDPATDSTSSFPVAAPEQTGAAKAPVDTGSAAAASSHSPRAQTDARVERIVDSLLAGGSTTPAIDGRAAGRADRVLPPASKAALAPPGNASGAGASSDARFATLSHRAGANTGNRTDLADTLPANFYGGRLSPASDPSYVFFRRSVIPTVDGPTGALGVPLTAGRSIAVDPRVTPLGAPVFIATGAGTDKGLSRLVVAQDIGGAIRGPVRADFFWGFGRSAGERALATRETLRQWVLLPKGAKVMLNEPRLRTRSLGARPDCLIFDEDYCAE